MRIVVLDGYAANPGDISWNALKALGDVTIYDRTNKDEILSRLEGADAALTNKVPFARETLEKLPNLKYIGVLATGYNIVDTECAKELDITVTNIPAYSTNSVSQLVFALILEIASHAGAHSDACLSGAWAKSRDFCFWNYPLTELHGKTLGIIGHGTIGKAVHAIALAFGMNVITYSPSQNEKDDLLRLYKDSDIISLNCPLKPDNKEMINKTTLPLMKKGAWLINTARGGLVNEQDVKDALVSGQLGAFAADVVSQEPILETNPLLSAPNVILTPHIAWATFEARTRLMEIAVNNVKGFISGNIINCVNV